MLNRWKRSLQISCLHFNIYKDPFSWGIWDRCPTLYLLFSFDLKTLPFFETINQFVSEIECVLRIKCKEKKKKIEIYKIMHRPQISHTKRNFLKNIKMHVMRFTKNATIGLTSACQFLYRPVWALNDRENHYLFCCLTIFNPGKVFNLQMKLL